MRRTLSLLCGAIALLCLMSIFMPIVAPKYSIQMYHAGSKDYTREYTLVGDYYYARQYWSMTRFALSSGNSFMRIVHSASMALLLYWAILSFLREKVRFTGVLAAMVNLVVTVYLVSEMLKVMAECRWGVLVVIGIDTLLAVAVAWIYFFAERGRKKQYITVPLSVPNK